MPVVVTSGSCPCGSALEIDRCCGPLLRNERVAAGVEELMRSRYTAYAVGHLDHLFRTWHPRTRPEDIAPDEGLAWTSLEIVEVLDGDEEGYVEFRAYWSVRDQSGCLHERSRFVRRAGRWVYLDGIPQGG